MNDEEFFEKYAGNTEQPFESPEAISKHLLEVDAYENQVINKDTPRGNYNKDELRFLRVNGGLRLELMEAEEMCGWNLNITKKKHEGKAGVMSVTSRGKDGWASVLAKTDKQISVQEMSNITEKVAENFSEETEQGLLQKIFKPKTIPGQ